MSDPSQDPDKFEDPRFTDEGWKQVDKRTSKQLWGFSFLIVLLQYLLASVWPSVHNSWLDLSSLLGFLIGSVYSLHIFNDYWIDRAFYRHQQLYEATYKPLV
jgi:hypothetical protein